MAFYKMVIEKIVGPKGAFSTEWIKKGEKGEKNAEGLKRENPLQNRGRNVIIINQ